MIIAWRDFQMNHPDLYHMLCDVFELMEIRKQIAVLKEGVVIEIRTKEQGHNIPHIHAHYQGESISVSLLDNVMKVSPSLGVIDNTEYSATTSLVFFISRCIV